MSYDLYVVRRDIPENFWDYGYDPDYDYGCYFNYTYNLGPFFAAYHVRPSTDSDGQLVDWGSVDGAIKWLERVQDYCREHPDYIVRERS